MILCAGLGNRLRPLTEELPKPLVPIGDRSVLAHIAGQLRRSGYTSAVANTHWLHDSFNSIISDLELALTLIHEPIIRGVAGAIAGARQLLDVPLLVWNGDVLVAEPPLDALTSRVAVSGGICLAVAPTAGPGTVGLDADGRVVRVRGEAHGREVRAGDYVGVCALGQVALRELPEYGCLIGDYCLPRLRRGEPVDTCPVAGKWWDVGSVVSYLAANRDWLDQHPNAGGGSFVAGSARVDPKVTLLHTVVGENARMEGSGLVQDCVLWPGSVARAPLSRCVVTPRGLVPVGPASV